MGGKFHDYLSGLGVFYRQPPPRFFFMPGFLSPHDETLAQQRHLEILIIHGETFYHTFTSLLDSVLSDAPLNTSPQLCSDCQFHGDCFLPPKPL